MRNYNARNIDIWLLAFFVRTLVVLSS